MKFSEVVKNNAPDLVVSRRHEEWLARNANPVYSDRALDFAAHQLAVLPRVRKGTISASSLGGCKRKQQFEYIGMPQLPMDTKGALKVQNGMFMHLRWQMAGLTEGWLLEAEEPVPAARSTSMKISGLSGTMDGILYDESVLELKSINAHGFSSLVTFGPPHEHLIQMSAYLLCTGRKKGVFIYENKDTQEYTEIVLDRDQLPLPDAELGAQDMLASNLVHELYEPLNDCMDQKGWRYQSCPYRDRCLEVRSWEELV